MNIGIDVDGVIMDTEKWFRAYAEIFDLDNNGKGKIYPEEFLFQRKYDWSDETTNKFVEQYGFYIEEKAPLMPCVKLVLDKLKKDGHKLILITARGTFGKKEEKLTLKVLRKNKLKFDKIYLSSHDKANICKKENIDYMIDDSPINVKNILDNNIKCIYFRAQGSEIISHKNLTEVHSWGEIYRFFTNNKNAK